MGVTDVGRLIRCQHPREPVTSLSNHIDSQRRQQRAKSHFKEESEQGGEGEEETCYRVKSQCRINPGVWHTLTCRTRRRFSINFEKFPPIPKKLNLFRSDS